MAATLDTAQLRASVATEVDALSLPTPLRGLLPATPSRTTRRQAHHHDPHDTSSLRTHLTTLTQEQQL
ncbi:hypothetical protein, partial [Streptomyces aculeolatus]|uniref:hypothetical protein n=1 Tax=Streptomyces aculeolatus TaxID=270689 RepID=UPI001CED4A80